MNCKEDGLSIRNLTCRFDPARALVNSMMTLLAIIWGSLPLPANAQAAFPLNSELPPMVLRVCAGLAGAVEQAELSRRVGLEPFSRARVNEARSRSCEAILVSITPRRRVPTIVPYMTWMTTYVPGSDTTFQVTDRGKTYAIPYRTTLQRTTFYEADVYDPINNDRYSAWAEIPDRPYLLEYFRDNPR